MPYLLECHKLSTNIRWLYKSFPNHATKTKSHRSKNTLYVYYLTMSFDFSKIRGRNNYFFAWFGNNKWGMQIIHSVTSSKYDFGGKTKEKNSFFHFQQQIHCDGGRLIILTFQFNLVKPFLVFWSAISTYLCGLARIFLDWINAEFLNAILAIAVDA